LHVVGHETQFIPDKPQSRARLERRALLGKNAGCLTPCRARLGVPATLKIEIAKQPGRHGSFNGFGGSCEARRIEDHPAPNRLGSPRREASFLIQKTINYDNGLATRLEGREDLLITGE
jgi:hypothetical protein